MCHYLGNLRLSVRGKTLLYLNTTKITISNHINTLTRRVSNQSSIVLEMTARCHNTYCETGVTYNLSYGGLHLIEADWIIFVSTSARRLWEGKRNDNRLTFLSLAIVINGIMTGKIGQNIVPRIMDFSAWWFWLSLCVIKGNEIMFDRCLSLVEIFLMWNVFESTIFN